MKALNVFSILLLVCTISLIGKTAYNELSYPAVVKADAEQPMIDTAAVNAYKKGEISKVKAHKEISGRLDELAQAGAITSWSYDSNERQYLVIMNGGTVFAYEF